MENSTPTSSSPITYAIALGIMLAGCGVFYYFAIFMPNLEKEKIALEQQKIADEEARLEAEKREAERIAEEARLDAERKEQARVIAYEKCINNANKNYHSNWGKNCKINAKRNQERLNNCLNNPTILNNQFMGESYCYQQFGNTNSSEDCSLPSSVADDLNSDLQNSKDRCLQEAQNNLL